jgi:hypothetical protein
MWSIRAALAELVAAVEFNDGQPSTKKSFVDLYEASTVLFSPQAFGYAKEYDQYVEDLKEEGVQA